MEEDNRSAPRHKVLKATTISFGGGAISCTVRNLSDGGASLEVASPRTPMPVIWRKEKRIGVRFTQPSTRTVSSPHGRQYSGG